MIIVQTIEYIEPFLFCFSNSVTPRDGHLSWSQSIQNSKQVSKARRVGIAAERIIFQRGFCSQILRSWKTVFQNLTDKMTVKERHNRTTILDSHRYTTNSIVEAKKQPKLRSAFYKLAGPSLEVEYLYVSWILLLLA